MAKLILDKAAALGILIVSFPVVLIAAALIRLESKGSPLFMQERLGRHEKPFTCYKLRTMRAGTPNAASHEVGAATVTRVGAFLRRTKIDELPQLWNVLRGEMSLVGPRPGLPVQTDLTAARRAEGVFEAIPGITGLAQLRGVDMSTPELLAKVDREYIDTRSLALDLRLLADTALGRGSGDPASKAS